MTVLSHTPDSRPSTIAADASRNRTMQPTESERDRPAVFSECSERFHNARRELHRLMKHWDDLLPGEDVIVGATSRRRRSVPETPPQTPPTENEIAAELRRLRNCLVSAAFPREVIFAMIVIVLDPNTTNSPSSPH